MSGAYDIGVDVFQLAGETRRDDGIGSNLLGELEKTYWTLKLTYSDLTLQNKVFKDLIEK